MIELRNVKLNISNIDILNELSLDIPNLSVTCIVGNKNAGKSSILKIISGVYKNYYGEVLYNGYDINDIEYCKIDILHESREKVPNITVSEYLKFYYKIYNEKEIEDINVYIDSMIKKFSIMSYKYTLLNMLDNENYKIVELIRILINDPEVILFDNLFSSENDDFNEKLLEYIKHFISKKTLVFASRSLNYIEEIATHIAVLDAGSLVSYGEKEKVYKNAELSNKIELEVIDRINDAIELLKKCSNVTNIVYNDKSATFSIVQDIAYGIDRNKIEADILKMLVDNGIDVYSFKKQRVKFEQLFGRLRK